MDDVALAEAKAWMHKARDDLNSAKKLLAGYDPYPATAAYHCQQAVEKALKGFLAGHDVSFPRTHDLRVLVSVGVEIEATLDTFHDTADLLTPYATEFRYPTGCPDPTPEEAAQAIHAAEAILTFVDRALG